MTFEQNLGVAAGHVEQHLAGLLGEMTDVPRRLLAAMRHAVLGGGKRFRPFLVLETARLFDVAAPEAITAAAALECVHCYSLVHDDLPSMDADMTRRGQPTVWKAYDEWTAILAGDALLTLAFELMASPAASPDPAIRAALVAGLARASGPAGMVGGQCLDLEAEKLAVPAAPGLAHIVRLQAMKTGALITFACEAGGLIAGASPAQHAGLRTYGAHLGLAYQIADDLLDVEGDAAIVGKAVAKDAAAGKATLVSLLGGGPARSRLAQAQAEAIAALAPFGAKADGLIEAARFVANRRS